MARCALPVLLAILCGLAAPAVATEKPQTVPQQAEINERLGEKIDLNLNFTDENGKQVKLSELVAGGKPLIIAPVYFECPRLCSLTQEGLTDALKALDLDFVKDFHAVSVSFNSSETPEFAKKKADTYHALLAGKVQSEQGWQFLTGNSENTNALMSQLGFGFALDPGESGNNEFLHAAVLMVITPDGRISRYLYGIRFLPRDLRLALIEAADGKIGSVLNRILMYCFRYDHIQGRYTLAIMSIIRVVCLFFFFSLMTWLVILRLREN